MNQTLPSAIENWRSVLGGTGFLVAFSVVAVFLFVVWVMWLVFPLVMYYQIRGLQSRLAQLHGDLVEINLRLRESHAATEKIQAGFASDSENHFDRRRGTTPKVQE